MLLFDRYHNETNQIDEAYFAILFGANDVQKFVSLCHHYKDYIESLEEIKTDDVCCISRSDNEQDYVWKIALTDRNLCLFFDELARRVTKKHD